MDQGDERRVRARDLGIGFGRLEPGPLNAITDVPGVLVGHSTVCWGGPDLPSGQGPARTGVTAVLPHGGDLFHERVTAGAHVANGVGELIGITPLTEWGLIETPVLLTNSQAIGAVYDATVRWMMARDERVGVEDAAMPVVGECDDSLLNDMRGMHVLPEHVHAALDSAASGPVAEGCVGAGTGTVCFDFKGGIGTASRRVEVLGATYTVGILTQTNLGCRHLLRIAGVPVGREIADLMPEEPGRGATVHHEGSCVVVVATDAPLSSRLCSRLAGRASLGLAQVGSIASDGSGEIMLAFSTAARLPRQTTGLLESRLVANDQCDILFEATVEATAEAVVNSLCAAETTTGRGGSVAHALPLDRLQSLLRRYGRLGA